MNVKIDTKEKFSVLTPQQPDVSANMTEAMEKLADYATKEVPHLVINMSQVKEISSEPARALAILQQIFYERDHSFVICNLQPKVEAVFEKEELIDVMNITPTESEAWDIVQMEEIERELMGDFEEPSPLDPPKGED